MGHLPTFVLTSDLYESLRQASLQENFDALEAASELGIKKMVLHPGYITGLGKFLVDKARGYGMESIEAILKKAGSLGITLCIEKCFLRQMFLIALKSFKISSKSFQIFALFLISAMPTSEPERTNPQSSFAVTVTEWAVHANDNFGKEDNHLPIGAGIIDSKRY